MHVSQYNRMVTPLRGSKRSFASLPRADALGYLLDAPTALDDQGKAR